MCMCVRMAGIHAIRFIILRGVKEIGREQNGWPLFTYSRQLHRKPNIITIFIAVSECTGYEYDLGGYWDKSFFFFFL